MFEGKITVDVSNRLATLLSELTNALNGSKPVVDQLAAPATTKPAGVSQPPVKSFAGPATPAIQNGSADPTKTFAGPATPVVPSNPVPATQAPVSSTPAPVPSAPAAPVTSAAPVAPAPTYTPAQIGAAGAALIQANPAKKTELVSLLQQFGVNAVVSLKPEQLGAFATALRGLGATI